MKAGYFITGTDTNAGKTWTTIALMRCFIKQGQSVAGMKPVASGCSVREGKPVNEDALLIQANASIELPYDLINPYAYELPVSPHLAGTTNPVDPDRVLACFNELKELADILLVEGAGGWYAPINDRQDISDLARILALPVILVVAIRLGCINHAKLTREAIERSGLHCAGWVAVCVDPAMPCLRENIDSLEKAIRAPLLGTLPYLERADFDRLSEHLHSQPLMGLEVLEHKSDP
ncbi:MAG: dethiobiotin synthase [Gammaproteobacteria bacterium]